MSLKKKKMDSFPNVKRLFRKKFFFNLLSKCKVFKGNLKFLSLVVVQSLQNIKIKGT